MATVKAVPTGPLPRKADGTALRMTPGPCLWCGEYVTAGRDLAGATQRWDPCWHNDGDFGCFASPETCADGTGDHARPFDLALRLLGYGYDGKKRITLPAGDL